MNTQQEIYHALMKTYEITHKIGRVKPYDLSHAKHVAYAASINIYNRELKKQQQINRNKRRKPLTTTLSAPKGQRPWSPVGCCQLELFSKELYKLKEEHPAILGNSIWKK